MLTDLLRFNQLYPLPGPCRAGADATAGRLPQRNTRAPSATWYFLPMLGCIWSCPTDQMLKFQLATMIRFCHNHGLIKWPSH